MGYRVCGQTWKAISTPAFDGLAEQALIGGFLIDVFPIYADDRAPFDALLVAAEFVVPQGFRASIVDGNGVVSVRLAFQEDGPSQDWTAASPVFVPLLGARAQMFIVAEDGLINWDGAPSSAFRVTVLRWHQ